jgi:flagellar hook-associated protein 3 FlgL
VQDAINAEDKVSQIKSMMTLSQYADTESQQKLQTYLDAAQKEADYANDNLQKTYEQYITNFDDYLERINEGITNVGSMEKRLEMIQTRVENQQTTIKELKSTNEDRDISDIIIDYYAAYNAYQASLTAASKVGDQTLLNYL